MNSLNELLFYMITGSMFLNVIGNTIKMTFGIKSKYIIWILMLISIFINFVFYGISIKSLFIGVITFSFSVSSYDLIKCSSRIIKRK